MTNTSCHVFYLWLFPFPKWPPTSWRAIPSCRRYLSCLCSLEGGYTLSRLAPLSTSHHACSSPSALHLCCSSSSFPWGEMRLLFEYYCKWKASNCMCLCCVRVSVCMYIIYKISACTSQLNVFVELPFPKSWPWVFPGLSFWRKQVVLNGPDEMKTCDPERHIE